MGLENKKANKETIMKDTYSNKLFFECLITIVMGLLIAIKIILIALILHVIVIKFILTP